jgi:hypothetical protein
LFLRELLHTDTHSFKYLFEDVFKICQKIIIDGIKFKWILGPKMDEVTADWRKLHNEDLHDLYSLPDIIRMIKSRRMRWTGHVARMGETGNEYRILVGKPEGKRPLGRPRVDNTEMHPREIGWDGVDWIELALDKDQ